MIIREKRNNCSIEYKNDIDVSFKEIQGPKDGRIEF